jgi:hypothetical protein
MSEGEMGVWWVFSTLVNSLIENIAPFTDSNKNCECMQRGIFGTCNEVTSNSTVINNIVMK